ncbi:MAG: LLM class flavin-dependent oxidoreductase [Alphaproteobacteria bacterium]
MEIGFFYWPYTPELVERMARAADAYGYDMIGIADTPGNAMDPWVATAMTAQIVKKSRIALCVTNLESRHPSVSAASIASIDLLTKRPSVLGIGAGHSGTKNLGIGNTSVDGMERGVTFMRELLTGAPARLGDAEAHLPWVKRPSSVYIAASGPRTLRMSGTTADGTFVNFGIKTENMTQSEGTVLEGLKAAGRDPSDHEMWQVAALDCNANGDAARNRVGAILAFMAAGYILGRGDLQTKGVPEELHGPLLELRKLYSTRPGDGDAELVSRLGLFDYLTERFAIYGTPEQCLDQLERARDAGLKRVIFTVSVASNPAGTVELFGKEVLPRFRG